MSRFENFVRGELSEAITNVADELLFTTTTPYRDPPNSDPETARLILTDSFRAPTVFEIVKYKRASASGGAILVRDLIRGQEGTTAQAWPAGTVVTQDITAGLLRLLELQERQVYVYGGSVDTTIRAFMPDGSTAWTNSSADQDILSLVADADNNVYAGTIDNKVLKINPSGGLEWSHSHNVGEVIKVAVDHQGNVYSLNATRLVKANPSGAQIWQYSASLAATDFTIDENGVCYVLEDAAIKKISPAGDLLVNAGFAGGGTAGIHIATSGFLYATIKTRVRKFTKDIDEVLVFDGSGGKPNVFGGIIQSDRDGNIYVAGEASSGGTTYGLMKINASDAFVWGGLSGDPYQFNNAGSRMILTFDDRIILAGLAQSFMYAFDTNGNALPNIGSFFGGVMTVTSNAISERLAVKYGDPPTLGRVSYSEVTDKPLSQSALILRSTTTAPATPPTGQCVIYFDGTDVIAKFDNGTTDVIATKGI